MYVVEVTAGATLFAADEREKGFVESRWGYTSVSDKHTKSLREKAWVTIPLVSMICTEVKSWRRTEE